MTPDINGFPEPIKDLLLVEKCNDTVLLPSLFEINAQIKTKCPLWRTYICLTTKLNFLSNMKTCCILKIICDSIDKNISFIKDTKINLNGKWIEKEDVLNFHNKLTAKNT